MTTETVRAYCHGCDGVVPGIDPHGFYCPACIKEQEERHELSEREAFDAFHAFADACIKRSR